MFDYMVTSNHIHLLVYDDGRKNVIPKSIQLIAGRLGQEYNQRKSRKGAFWEDRYHATAVESGSYLMRCLIYIDLNMVRAGVVSHPSEWECCGYHELQNIPERKRTLDYTTLIELLEVSSYPEFKELHKNWIQESLKKEGLIREEKWTKSLAVGSQFFIESIKGELGIRGKYRQVVKNKENWELKEEINAYRDFFGPKNARLRAENHEES